MAAKRRRVVKKGNGERNKDVDPPLLGFNNCAASDKRSKKKAALAFKGVKRPSLLGIKACNDKGSNRIA